ncbi:MAG: thiamine phosphate synthase [Lautropia sp.]|nr:thiamine phosphate synthase [Lautropia sp.]
MTDKTLVDVAVGVVLRPDGQVLLGQRLSGKSYHGWWEFPGGKFEAGEDAATAVARELKEEIGIQVHHSWPWVVREHVYGHAHVRLHFRRIIDWSGEPHSAEGQALAWQPAHAVGVGPLLPASLAPIRWLGLPETYAISNATELGRDAWLARLAAWLKPWKDAGLASRLPDHGRNSAQTIDNPAEADQGADAKPASASPLLLLREPDMDEAAFSWLFEAVIDQVRGTGVRVLVSSRHAHHHAQRASDETGGGIHLTADDLRAVAEAQAKQTVWPPSSLAAEQAGAGQQDASDLAVAHPALAAEAGVEVLPGWRVRYRMVGASCHTADDLQRAGAVEVDFAVCGPVQPTPSHPEAAGCGWDGFAAIMASTPVPVYALGGLRPADLDTARRVGAQGVAMQRGAW